MLKFINSTVDTEHNLCLDNNWNYKYVCTVYICNQLLASLLTPFPCKLNTFKKGVKNVVTREFNWGLIVNKWSDVKCSDVEWTEVIYLK
jgi:hypothetical protein